MTNEIYLVAVSFGSTLLSLVGLYVGWRSARVILLRLELKSIRDRLWDSAYRLGKLNDSVYLEYRRNLNLMVQYAHCIDLVSVALTDRTMSASQHSDSTDDSEFGQALTEALRETGKVMSRYMLWYRPFSGILLIWTLKYCSKLFRVFRSLTSLAITPSIAEVLQFGKKPDAKTREWFAHNGPTIVFRKWAA